MTKYLSKWSVADIDDGGSSIRIDIHMKDVIEAIDGWLSSGESRIAVATVIETWGSSPRKAGARMAFTADGKDIAGSVSGGCVEGAVIEAGTEVLATGRPQLLHFGVADETAWNVGLACGGTIDVFVECLNPAWYHAARELTVTGKRGAIATVIRGPAGLAGRRVFITGDEITSGAMGFGLDDIALQSSREARQSARLVLAGDLEIFIDVFRPPPTLHIVGGAHIAVALTQMAGILGFRTVIIDPRRAFAGKSRFPAADRLITEWPEKAFAENPIDADSAVVTLSHDLKIDDPALRSALNSEAFYIGALGSRKTNANRRQRLAAAGFTDAQLERIHAPVGLDIGADTPEEIALAILAEVVGAYRRRVTVRSE